jgi:Family of unknown function (DUF5330)
MSFLKLAFWLALLVLLLPTDAYQQARLTTFANTAMERVSSFCDRNGKTCAAGGDLWATFLRKAEFGVRLVGDLLGAGGRQAPVSRPDMPPNAAPPPPDPRTGRADPRGTLAPSDLYHPPWRGPSRSGGG